MCIFSVVDTLCLVRCDGICNRWLWCWWSTMHLLISYGERQWHSLDQSCISSSSTQQCIAMQCCWSTLLCCCDENCDRWLVSDQCSSSTQQCTAMYCSYNVLQCTAMYCSSTWRKRTTSLKTTTFTSKGPGDLLEGVKSTNNYDLKSKWWRLVTYFHVF